MILEDVVSDAEKEFEYELEVFRIEVNMATQAFYSWLVAAKIFSNDKLPLYTKSESVCFLGTVRNALDVSFMLSLGRLFDKRKDCNFNLRTISEIAKKNINIFSKESLRSRKAKNGFHDDNYINKAYSPTNDDFVELDRQIDIYRKKYEKYNIIRNKVHAHREFSHKEPKFWNLFDETKISELEEIFAFLNQLDTNFFELYHNGRKFNLEPATFSIYELINKEKTNNNNTPLQQRVVYDAKKFFELLQ